MSSPLINAMRLQAERAVAALVVSRVGIVTSYDPNAFAVRVSVQPDNILSGWMPLASPWIGNGWGMFAAPSIGDMVEVIYLDGRIDAGTAIGRFYNDEDKPLAVAAGEFWLVHKSGQFVKFTNDGKLKLADGHGATITLDGAGNITSQATQWTHTGAVEFKSAVHFDDNVQVDKTLTANTDVVGGGKSLKTHVHSGIQSGGSNTGPPA